MNHQSILISVVICTYNRADLLATALQTVCEQTIEQALYEVIVVDNNSTDHTYAVAQMFRQRYPHVHYLFAAQPGNSHARNVGWQHAQGKFVGFMDDDCKAPATWLMKAKTIIETSAPGVFGGPFYGFYNSPKSPWFKDEYGAYVLADPPRSLEHPEELAAGNLFIRADVLQRAGGFTPELGITEKRRGYGEETALLHQIRLLMPDLLVYYDPELFVHHLVRPEKMRLMWHVQERFLQGRCTYWVYHSEIARPSWFGFVQQSALVLAKFAVRTLLAFCWRDRKTHPYLQNYLYEYNMQHLMVLGRLYEQFLDMKSYPSIKHPVT